ncbi:tRNA (adenosine(37)-N6)-dimethylallyltransferase MiaA [Sulfobacillus thermotolerans]|uniref:tRNA dimethylallyltransferase n=1 Tax=Sulfobacillus thermotolerans TaxID=338644 RepID=A0ABM6RVE9_9FIRM|nr:tRNA (adenosine(37)-N6)-dimethylallyltransferase MiaA [Sulfobacillus thermotolerans]
MVILAGPTSVGKTDVSLAVAEALQGEIISCDSAQIFQGVDIGTAKIPLAERRGIPHFGLDLVDASATFSVAEYQQYAKTRIHEIWARGHLPIMVGGTGLWIRAVVQDFIFTPQDPALSAAIRRHIRQLADEQGWEKIRDLLKVLDPVSYDKIAANDKNRITRALEVVWTTGRPLKRQGQPSPYRVDYWVLTRPIADLHQRITQRTHQMIAQGLPEEVLGLLSQGVPAHAQSLSAIGYRETVQWAFGRSTAAERDEFIARHTKQYAKRQLTWFRSEKAARWLDLSLYGFERVAAQIISHAQELVAVQRQKT